jgi:hypothetical protein
MGNVTDIERGETERERERERERENYTAPSWDPQILVRVPGDATPRTRLRRGERLQV